MFNEDYLSDEEIYFGKLSIKEIRKHVMIDSNRHSVTCGDTKLQNSDSDNSLKLIETCSEPDLKTETSNHDTNLMNNSFTEIEKNASEPQTQTNNNHVEELDNTLDVVEYILNNAPTFEDKNRNENEKLQIINTENFKIDAYDLSEIQVNVIEPQNHSILSELKTDKCHLEDIKHKENVEFSTPSKITNVSGNSAPVSSSTKSISKMQKSKSSTPCNDKKTKVPIFKTPKSPISQQKQLVTPHKTPCNLNSYQHITSPVAKYIRNRPQIPVLKDIKPKKPCSNLSSIPKLLKSTKKESNKENVILPSIAYKSAKTKKVINGPDEENLQEGHIAKALSSSLPKPAVIKHDQRLNMSKKNFEPQSEDSFANLTLHQAEVSVCTQKTAFNKIQKKPA